LIAISLSVGLELQVVYGYPIISQNGTHFNCETGSNGQDSCTVTSQGPPVPPVHENLNGYAPGYQPTLEEFCIAYNGEILKIVAIGEPCPNVGDAISKLLVAGFHIDSTNDRYVFMTKGVK
jgi:hypothetical protein